MFEELFFLCIVGIFVTTAGCYLSVPKWSENRCTLVPFRLCVGEEWTIASFSGVLCHGWVSIDCSEMLGCVCEGHYNSWRKVKSSSTVSWDDVLCGQFSFLHLDF